MGTCCVIFFFFLNAEQTSKFCKADLRIESRGWERRSFHCVQCECERVAHSLCGLGALLRVASVGPGGGGGELLQAVQREPKPSQDQVRTTYQPLFHVIGRITVAIFVVSDVIFYWL